MKKMKIKHKILLAFSLLLVVIIIGFLIYVNDVYKPSDDAMLAFNSNTIITTENDDYISFIPKGNIKDTAYIFYPGGKVDPLSYSTYAKKISEYGYPVYIAKMTFNLAIFSPNKADSIIEDNPEINHFVIGGHSLGGVMACSYICNNPDKLNGLILLASYPQSKNDLTDYDIEVLSLRGSNDGFVSDAKIEESKIYLPIDSIFYEIKGGNHSQFGDYGFQKGDNKATIDKSTQLNETVEQSIIILDDIDKSN
ncbi:MAG: alpha/beta hydrolase [Clostridiaceae bacterium]